MSDFELVLCHPSDCDLAFDVGMGFVVGEFEVFVCEIEDVCDFWVEFHCWERSAFTRELFVDLGEMVDVDVGVGEGVDEGAWAEVGDLGDHHGEQGVGGDVEGDSEEEIGGALVELAVEEVFATIGSALDIELEEAMAWGEGHILDLSGVPCGDDVSA